MISVQTPPNARLRAKKILLVEDDAAVCYFLERVLRKSGYVVGMAADGSAGLHLFHSQSWDLVITDRAMPQMSGEELAREIRKDGTAPPIVLITGFPSHVDHPELFDAVFGKPFSIADLLACLSALLQAHPAHAGPE
jgi:DNA-binding response OmpR family regulator